MEDGDDQFVINSFVEHVGMIVKANGWRHDWELAGQLEVFANQIEREGGVGPDLLRKAAEALRTNYLGMLLALAHTEISEMTEVLRAQGARGVLADPERFVGEGADGNIRIMDLVDLVRGDFGYAVVSKIDKRLESDTPEKRGTGR